MITTKKYYIFAAAVIFSVLAILVLFMGDTIKNSAEEGITAIADPGYELCDNYEDRVVFKDPIPVVWEAELTGCLVSCEGAHFTRLPKDASYKYSRFAGYLEDGAVIPAEFLKDGITLKVHGLWESVDADHPFTVFEDKCVPIIDMNKIEIIKTS